MRPRLLDLFSGAGGAGKGYHAAGFDIVGVDIAPQPRYPFEFHQADALAALDDYMTEGDGSFAAIHASPPCQAFSKAQRIRSNDHPDDLMELRAMLKAAGVPYVIENVPGAPLKDPVLLCGSMFPDLRVYRHRLFECSFPATAPLHAPHFIRQVKMGRKPGPGEFHQPVGNFTDAAGAREALGTPWMTRGEMAECIPPAYTRHIGVQLMAHLSELWWDEMAA